MKTPYQAAQEKGLPYVHLKVDFRTCRGLQEAEDKLCLEIKAPVPIELAREIKEKIGHMIRARSVGRG